MELRVGSDELSTAGERRQAAAVVVFGSWMVTGLFLDGWSHNHQRPETFFTPWHAVLYSGFAAAVVWFAWEGSRERRAGLAPTPTVGGGLTALGLVVFAAAAVGDFGWHLLFGIERNVAALLSPTHLLLMTGGLLMVTGPLRAAWHRPSGRVLAWPDAVPVIGSVTLAVMVVSFFLMYLSPFRATVVVQPAVVGRAFNYLVQDAQIRTIGAVLIANSVMLGAMLLVMRRWHPPAGAFTAMFGVVAVAMSGLDSFERLPLALCALAGGVAADVMVALLPIEPPSSGAVRRLAMAVPVAMWLPYFLIFKFDYHLPWVIHLWLGSVFLAALDGLALSLLAFPPMVPA